MSGESPHWGNLNRVERKGHKITWLQVLNIVPYTQIQMYNHDMIVTGGSESSCTLQGCDTSGIEQNGQYIID